VSSTLAGRTIFPKKQSIMPKKKIATVGFWVPGHNEMYMSFNSNTSLLDFDIAIFDPNIRSFFGNNYREYRGKPTLDDSRSFRLKERIVHWRTEISEAIRAGKTIFILLNGFQEVYVATGTETYSGTGQNRQTTREVEPTNNLNIVPAKISFREAKGSSMHLVGSENILASYWAACGIESEYRVILDGENVSPLILPRTGKMPVGGCVKWKEGGALHLLPYLDFSREDFITTRGEGEEEEEEEIWTAEAVELGEKFISGIVGVDKNGRIETAQTPPPTWLEGDDRFQLPEEKRITEKLLQTNSRIEKFQNEKSELLARLVGESVLKGLIYEKGPPLETAITKALGLLGFDAKKYKENDSEFDVVFEAQEGRLLGEAEGKDKKAINIDKLRQLEMNLHEDLSREEIDEPAKGVLFGNAFRFTPPDERAEFFTAKCLTAAKRSGTALVRSTDLFAAAKYLSEKKDKGFAKSCRQAIVSSTGVVNFPAAPVTKSREKKEIVAETPEGSRPKKK
jgi:hypothetical protein